MDYEQFKSQILSLTKIDLNAYKERQMKRRIDALIAKNKYPGYREYVDAIKTNNRLFEEFVNYLTINVSEFWRNPEQWKVLEQEIFPELIKSFGKNLKIWSAACSTGDEPYSLVMLLSKFVPLDKISILFENTEIIGSFPLIHRLCKIAFMIASLKALLSNNGFSGRSTTRSLSSV